MLRDRKEMKGLTPSYLLSILESSYRKQVSPLSLFIKASLNWNQLTERFGFKGVLYTKVSPRVFVLCRWNEISYLNQQFAEELNSIKLPTFHHNALNIHLPEIASISLATRSFSFVGIPWNSKAPAFFASKRILLRSRFNHTAGSNAFAR